MGRRRSAMRPGNASGIPLPTNDQAGWTLAYANDFNSNFATGAVSSTGVFPAPYASDLWAFPLGWADDNANLNADDSQYDPQSTLSVSGSILRQHMTVITGSARSTVVGVYPSPGTGRLYGRFSVCFRVPVAFHGWKTAWLLWPDFPGDGRQNGEIDYPEGDLDGIDTITGFMHWQNATTGSQQTTRPTTVVNADGLWHRGKIVWLPTGCEFWIDGVKQGTTITANIPANPMHWILQSEVVLAGGPNPTTPVLGAEGHLQLDWIVCHQKDGIYP